MENQGGFLHVVMFPWLAMGHLIPFLHLSKCLASKGHHVSFISTPRNLSRLPKIPPNLTPSIDLVNLPFPQVENLPEQAESSMDIPYKKAQFLKMAFDLLKLPLTTFLGNTSPKPDWIIYDYASHWLPSLASKLGISCAYFSLFNASTMAFIGIPPELLNEEGYARTKAEDFTVVPKWVPFESDIVYRLHEVMKFMDGSEGNESGTSDLERFAVTMSESDVILFRTCVEFEPEWFNLVSELYHKPVVPVGFLSPSLVNPETELDDEKWVEIKDWLDVKSVNSVVYVAIGTEAALSQDELTVLALGLEQSQLPFFWVLRKPTGWSTKDELEMLPNGFVDRVKDRGLVYVDWAPQVKILGHPAVGGFLTHCGWNSVIEGLSFGRVLVLLPVMNDQGLNARMLEGNKLGVEIPRNEQDGSFTSNSVAESIRLAMVSEEGETLRFNARDVKGLFGGKDIHDHYVDSFVLYLMDNKDNAIMP